jgi:hypothetical protein
MSKIVQLRLARAALAAAKAQLDALQDDPELKSLQVFESELRALLAKHSRSLVDVNQILDENYKAPKAQATGAAKVAKAAATTEGGRPTKTWVNPHTNEKIVSSHGNHTVLNEWRKKWGVEAVKGWATLNE